MTTPTALELTVDAVPERPPLELLNEAEELVVEVEVAIGVPTIGELILTTLVPMEMSEVETIVELAGQFGVPGEQEVIVVRLVL